MAVPLLATKLYVPRQRPGLVARPRLVDRLTRGVASRLILISAPPGFGKTTLLADWLGSWDAGSVAWLSLDSGDNNPSVFWSYLVAALRSVAPEAGANAAALLEPPQPPPIEAVLTTLINELGAIETEIVLVLDDYHLVETLAIHEGMAFFLDHLPPSLHLVISSRADPPLPLPRLRARGELVEVRAADLRFIPREAEAYLHQVMDLDLTPQDLATLVGRTEGWIAALQLAALSMQGRDDVPGFIGNFAGDDRYIVDYLVEEVLQRQPEEVRTFLLQTALLDRMSGPLCDAVTGEQGGRSMLESLERGNVFVVPLDDRRQWFRYHHLFADVLRAHLIDEQRDYVPELHRRASMWFEQNGEWPEAIRHATAAGDVSRVAGMVELAMPAMLRNRQDSILRGWLEALPDELVRLRPVLSAGYAGLLLNNGEFDAADGRLRDAERLLKTATHVTSAPQGRTDVPVFVDEEQFRELPGMIALYRAGHAQVVGNLTGTVSYARQALDLMPADASLRGGAMALLGLALWSRGDLEEAHKTYAEGIARVHLGGYVNDSSTITMADMRVAQGRLREALDTYQRALKRAEEMGKAAPRGTADLHVGISELYREMNELGAATEHLARSEQLGEIAGLPENRYRWFTAMAGIKQARKDYDGALDLLEQAERLYTGGFSPNVRPIPAMKARLWIAEGRLGEATAWAQQQALTPDDALSYLQEFEHVTLARLLLARFTSTREDRVLAQATGLLERLLKAAEEGARMGAVIEVLVLQALAHEARSDTHGALPPLQRALTLAEPEGYVRIFVDEGLPMATLLKQARNQGVAVDYARRLLAAFDFDEPRAPVAPAGIEPLSDRELEVLRLLASDLSGPDIANELVVSLNTMRTHTKNIYAKLVVNNRREAVRRAGELGLI
jgi:LuxR family maltose regulon positive regulatory protein